MHSYSLTAERAMRDGEGAARSHTSRGCAAHAVHSLRPSGLTGGAMVRRAYRQRSLVEVLLTDDDKLWDATLRQIDVVLDDDVLVDRVAEALAQRHPQSRRRGRLGAPAAVVLRMLILKHLHDWSFDECEREVRGSLVYRAFCRIDGERVPDAKTLIRLAHVLDEPVLKDVVARLVALGRERRVVRGRRLRVDTTVVETNIHYPTDATLLADGVRVLTRSLRRIGERVRERTRSVGPPGLCDRPAQSHGRQPGAPPGPRAEPGEDEGPLPGPHANHAHGPVLWRFGPRHPAGNEGDPTRASSRAVTSDKRYRSIALGVTPATGG